MQRPRFLHSDLLFPRLGRAAFRGGGGRVHHAQASQAPHPAEPGRAGPVRPVPDRISLLGQHRSAGDPVFSDLPAGFDGCRIVVLSDLHGASFGAHNADLLAAVAAEQPEYIFFLGDLEDKYRGPEDGYPAETARGLSAIAPTYYVTGNHEWAVGGVPALKEILTANGVTVLSNQFVPLERNGDTIVLAGIDDPNGYADQKTPEELAAEVYAACGDPFWILLAHRNNRFARQYSLLGADLVCSGHAHGGIVRLPGTDGLFSHDLDLFPSYTAGLFVTRGLGNSGPSFRVFNRPEIAVLTLRRAEG